MKDKICKKDIIIIALIIFIQTSIFIIVGMNKEYIHIDEAFSMGLANDNVVKIQNKEGFFNNWHDKEYYKDYLVVNEDEKFDFSPVYINQKNDVHPPLFYLLLRIAMSFHIGEFSIWSGLILNIIIYAFITIFMYLIINQLLVGKKNVKEKSAILALVSSLTFASIENMAYIRMYALSTLNVVLTTYLHFKLLESKGQNYKLLFFIGLVALLGSLTHYYYLFYLVMLFIMVAIHYIKEKDYQALKRYFITMVIAGVCSIIIFPYSIKHMFFGYRGQGAIANLSKISEALKAIGIYLFEINLFAFNGSLGLIIIVFLIIIIYKKNKKIKVFEIKNEYTKYMIYPSILYFLLVALSAPWKEIRYMLPICGIIFILVMYYFQEVLSNMLNERKVNIVMISVFCVIFITPCIINVLPIRNKYKPKVDVLYSGTSEIVDKLSNELNLPTLYVAGTKGFRFQDDILLFININESYMLLGKECNSSKLEEIFEGKNLQDGIIVFISEGQEKEPVLNDVKKTFNFENIQHIRRMNACDIYYLK